ncbi:uncharacterized protein [Temnothorax longispinosus]|uniref:uncharacterized protein isoform X1 n=1 Tax=Temnothorax longispinosus TaxID=300112 RepID=UPI003A9A4445
MLANLANTAVAVAVWLFSSLVCASEISLARTENVRLYCSTMSGKEKFSQMNVAESSRIYKLIEFISKDRCKGRSVDVVPCEWIVYDNEAGNLKTVFMPPPYTTETAELLHSLVKSRAEPPKSWPFYQINIVGDAKTYELALDKLKKLEEKKYVYSTESDHGESRALSDTKRYKLKAIKTNRDVEKKLLNVPPLYSDDDTCSLLSETSKESESISNNEENLYTKRQCQKTYSHNTIKNVISKDKEKQSGTKSNKHKFEKMGSVSHATKENKETEKTKKNSIALTSGQFQMSKAISKDMEKESRTLCKSNKQKLDKIEILSRAIKDNTETEKTEKNPIVLKSGQLQMSKGQYTDGNTTSNTKHCVEKSFTYLFDERKQYTTNDLARLVTSGFRSVCSQLTQLTLNINELKNIVSLEKNTSRQICTDIQFSEKYNMEFPCKTLENFMQFEENLKNKEFRQDFQHNLWKNIDTSTSLLKSLTNILKKYMSRDVAMAFTAVKKVDKKQILKTTIFSSCIQNVVIEEYSTSNAHPPITDKMYYSTLGSILNNAKDWEGHRLMRQKKLNPTHTEEELEETMEGDDDAVYE